MIEWAMVAGEVMHPDRLAPHGQDDDAVRWVAVRHAPDHIHIVAMLARQDGNAARLLERPLPRRRGLPGRRGTARAAPDRPRGPDQRATRPPAPSRRRPSVTAVREPPRITLRRAVSTAAATAASEHEFFARLGRRRGASVRRRLQHPQPRRDHRLRRRAACRHHARTGGPVWYGGGKLAAGPDPAQAAPPLGSASGGTSPRPSVHRCRATTRSGSTRAQAADRAQPPQIRHLRRDRPWRRAPTPPGPPRTPCTPPRRRSAAGSCAGPRTPTPAPPACRTGECLATLGRGPASVWRRDCWAPPHPPWTILRSRSSSGWPP